MNKIINKIANIIRGYGEHAWETESRRIKRDFWGTWASPDKQND
jgi:hypothetical protein